MTQRYYYRPWKEETLVAALHFMRCQIVREGAKGLEHIDALLRLRGVAPESLPVPQKFPKTFKRGQLTQAILRELRDGPLRGSELARRLQGNLAYEDAYKKVYGALHRLGRSGNILPKNNLWWLCGS
ncbi:MAG: hypothetical protein O9248_01715 [Rhodobacteraceae bacterium]|nr:hypothetical protein [Paracoccaceae bacterium]